MPIPFALLAPSLPLVGASACGCLITRALYLATAGIDSTTTIPLGIAGTVGAFLFGVAYHYGRQRGQEVERSRAQSELLHLLVSRIPQVNEKEPKVEKLLEQISPPNGSLSS